MPTINHDPTALTTSQGDVTSAHFGSNFLFDQDFNPDGTIEGNWYDQVTDAAHTQTLRFPGGTITETQFDLNDTAKLEEFLSYCSANGHKAMIVLPTFRFFDPDSPNSNYLESDAETIIKNFVQTVLDLADAQNPKVIIEGFEIGNEYYQKKFTNEDDLLFGDEDNPFVADEDTPWTTEQFARLQAQMASWVNDVVADNVGVYVQAGRNSDENDTLYGGFADAGIGLDVIDGVLTHLYYPPENRDLSVIEDVEVRIETIREVWGSSRELIVTEWNTSEANNYGGNNAVYGMARLAALTRGFADFIGHGVDQLLIWSTIAGGPNGRATLGLHTTAEQVFTPTGYWFRLMASELIDTQLVSDYGSASRLLDAQDEFVGYSYVFQGTTFETSNDYHLLYSNGTNGDLTLDLDLSNLMTNDSFVYAAHIVHTGALSQGDPQDAADPADPHATAELQFVTNFEDLEDYDLGAYEFLQVNIVTGHGIDLETDPFNAVDDNMSLTKYGDRLSTFDGNDSVYGGAGFDTVDGGDGNDFINGENHADSLLGGAGDDTLIGGHGVDQLFGGVGHDSLDAGSEADRVWGGDGNDIIRAGSNFGESVDGLWGEAGNDTLYGDAGFDYLSGGTGEDVLIGGDQADNLYGDAGNDSLYGGQGLDRMFGGDGNDYLYDITDSNGFFGEGGDDMMVAGNGNDRFFGGTGNDIISAGGGNDSIYGGAGFDTIIGGAGNDVMRGDFNADTFVFEDGHGSDTISDFDTNTNLEQIDLSGVSAIANVSDLNLGSATSGAATQVGADVVINTGGGNSIRLTGVNIADLEAGDFIF
ncbi:Bifunctional hemolysin/adenylate cyclase precursor [Pelagimonas phthalicica]|uniref:Bifunctional hemolysin/adenylate cyclase n=1 Tax=Pelagimonas phthalicica TaxID=1037362 RepID=A0A238JC33_9RHOB|nr:calcium-binding protein [Pelagimonas phthalicica]TDS91180.1 hemolysin type calcium-binding protein [Pelagimonas phthalicica]SMX28228.1 Bifunctional hemolysin/adenylate cyclase precursor [Pelagimonas phthalicica]